MIVLHGFDYVLSQVFKKFNDLSTDKDILFLNIFIVLGERCVPFRHYA
ncbi:hypothetical protein EV194_106124 [Natronoflexus pectinivorans]|uniref:Uncharacterized protein n=1 Tax=Natronoflexus pectinivorans TaxID=682526 RepID=A0A4R2GI75_9BACT|nr:hypothetical protein EV194_106124 [Natronoflexus pectinivorans]